MPDKWGIPTKKELTLYITRSGDRTLTPAQKRKLKEAVNYKCERCGKKFDSEYLQIHHKKTVASHKNAFPSEMVISQGKKYIPKYDRRKSNLQVICIKCHNKTKKRKKSSSRFKWEF